MTRARRRRAPPGFLQTEQGKLWLERKIEAKRSRRRDPGPGPKVLTRMPFKATINGEEVIVWPDWVEWPQGAKPYEPDYEEDE